MSSTRAEQLQFLKKVTGRVPELVPFGPSTAGYALGTCDDYPRVGSRTTVTFGVAQQGGSLWRGLPLGHELVMAHERSELDLEATIRTAVIENGRRVGGGERRPFIEANGVFAPGYAPHPANAVEAERKRGRV